MKDKHKGMRSTRWALTLAVLIAPYFPSFISVQMMISIAALFIVAMILPDDRYFL